MANLVTQHNASVAQLAEHALRKRMVMGSIPIRGFSFGTGVGRAPRATTTQYRAHTKARSRQPPVGFEPTTSCLLSGCSAS